MNTLSHTIVDMAELWDELTPRQQQFLIQRAKYLAGYNKLNEAKKNRVTLTVCPARKESDEPAHE